MARGSKNENGLTEKQEQFCIKFIETGSTVKAYQAAYSAEGMRHSAIQVEGSKLLDNPRITARLTTLREATVKRHVVTFDSIMAELEEARLAALGAASPQTSAAVQASMGKAKIAGMLSDKVDLRVDKFDEMSADELRAFIAEGSAQLGVTKRVRQDVAEPDETGMVH